MGLRDQLGTFMRSTLVQLDALREEVSRKGRAGRIQLDVVWLRRRRKEVLAELGEAVAVLAASGVIDEEKFPSLSAALAHLEAVDERIAREERRAREAAGGPVEAEPEEEVADLADDEE